MGSLVPESQEPRKCQSVQVSTILPSHKLPPRVLDFKRKKDSMNGRCGDSPAVTVQDVLDDRQLRIVPR